jgi:PilZ domain
MIDRGIPGERRADRRYEIQLDVRWRLVRRKKVLALGHGRTLNLSSGGIGFDAGHQLVPGLDIELSISWPILLHGTAPLQLKVSGRIQRVSGNYAGIVTTHHEFRTVATPIRQPASPGRSVAAQSPIFERLSRIQ